MVFTQPWPAGPADKRRDQVIFYQYRADRARRTLRGIDEQVAKAEKAVAGKVPVKRNRFFKLSGATKTVNRQLEAKARALTGLKGYVTNLDATAEFVIDADHRLFQIEKLTEPIATPRALNGTLGEGAIAAAWQARDAALTTYFHTLAAVCPSGISWPFDDGGTKGHALEELKDTPNVQPDRPDCPGDPPRDQHRRPRRHDAGRPVGMVTMAPPPPSYCEMQSLQAPPRPCYQR